MEKGLCQFDCPQPALLKILIFFDDFPAGLLPCPLPLLLRVPPWDACPVPMATTPSVAPPRLPHLLALSPTLQEPLSDRLRSGGAVLEGGQGGPPADGCRLPGRWPPTSPHLSGIYSEDREEVCLAVGLAPQAVGRGRAICALKSSPEFSGFRTGKGRMN